MTRRRSEATQTFLGSFSVIEINSMIVFIGAYVSDHTYPNLIYTISMGIILGISLFQLIYVIPAIFWLRQRQKFAFMKGVIIGAVITPLLNGACYYRFPGKFDLIKCYLHQLSEFLGCSGLPSNSTKARSHLFKFLEY